ncbi:MAG: nucleotidyltransferase domain-containing protein [Desulfomonilaceae bacterium]
MEQDLLNDLVFRLRPIFERRHVLRAIVFGSVARGEASRRSDLDLIIVQNTEKRFLDRYDGFLSEIVRAVPGMDVDVLIYTPQELALISGRPLIKTALTEGKVIYESDKEPERS